MYIYQASLRSFWGTKDLSHCPILLSICSHEFISPPTVSVVVPRVFHSLPICFFQIRSHFHIFPIPTGSMYILFTHIYPINDPEFVDRQKYIFQHHGAYGICCPMVSPRSSIVFSGHEHPTPSASMSLGFGPLCLWRRWAAEAASEWGANRVLGTTGASILHHWLMVWNMFYFSIYWE